MGFFYRLFGLAVESDRALPGLRTIAPVSACDVRLVCQFPPPQRESGVERAAMFVSADRDESGQPSVQVWELGQPDGFRFRYYDGTEFIVNRAATEVRANWAMHSTLEDTCTYLLGPVFGFVLRLRGITSLHASAVVVGGAAVALAGPAGAGKSTLATMFALAGHTVLTDDVSPLIERGDAILVQPAYPHLRLWPPAAEALFGTADALPRLTPNWEKRYFDVAEQGAGFAAAPLPLGAVYLLSGRESANAPRIESISPREALLALVANTYVNYLLDADMRAREFLLLRRIVEQIPVRRVVPHTAATQAGQLIEMLAEDVHRAAAGVSRAAS
jgi:Serine kinase of the HPr protein, regulates carbohydrate metabolism